MLKIILPMYNTVSRRSPSTLRQRRRQETADSAKEQLAITTHSYRQLDVSTVVELETVNRGIFFCHGDLCDNSYTLYLEKSLFQFQPSHSSKLGGRKIVERTGIGQRKATSRRIIIYARLYDRPERSASEIPNGKEEQDKSGSENCKWQARRNKFIFFKPARLRSVQRMTFFLEIANWRFYLERWHFQEVTVRFLSVGRKESYVCDRYARWEEKLMPVLWMNANVWMRQHFYHRG